MKAIIRYRSKEGDRISIVIEGETLKILQTNIRFALLGDKIPPKTSISICFYDSRYRLMPMVGSKFMLRRKEYVIEKKKETEK